MPRKTGGNRRKRRTHKRETQTSDSIPRSFVFRRGHVPISIRDLIPCLRTALMPNTARRLKERKLNNIRDYVSVAAKIGVTHFWILSATTTAPYLRIARAPQGPTITFRILQYTLSCDVRAIQRRPLALEDSHFEQPPVLVLNNFKDGDSHVQLMAETFRHSFPPIDVNSARLSSLKRVLLVNRDVETGQVYIRHYAMKVQQAGLSKPVRKMINKRRIPKMSNLTDVSQLMDGAPGVFSSDSEMEDNPEDTIELAQAVRKLKKGASSKIKLVEVGPRLTLELLKIQSGLCEGETLFHRYVKKSKNETEAAEKRIRARKDLKRKRREEQDANVKRKQEIKTAKKERHRKNIEARHAAEAAANEAEQKMDVGNEADDEEEE